MILLLRKKSIVNRLNTFIFKILSSQFILFCKLINNALVSYNPRFIMLCTRTENILEMKFLNQGLK